MLKKINMAALVLSSTYLLLGGGIVTVAFAAAAPAGSCVVGNEPSCFATKTDPAASGTSACTTKSCDLISKYIDPLITLLSAAVGLVVVISIIIGGIQYGSSAGDPQKVSAAKNRIRNSIIALVSFIFLYTFLQFLVPGGIFRK